MPELLPCPACSRHTFTGVPTCGHCSAPLRRGLTAGALLMALTAPACGVLVPPKGEPVYGAESFYEEPVEETGDTGNAEGS